MKTGRGAHFSGLAAEEIAERLYLDEGATVAARRWKCPEGEIDLILESGDGLVFVEVKARRRHVAAALAISAAQWRRIGAAASRYLAETTDGTVSCRFDVVLVDRSGLAERIENAATFDA